MKLLGGTLKATGILLVAAALDVLAVFAEFTISRWARPYLNVASGALLVISLVVLLPMALFKSSRRFAGLGLIFAAMIFAVTLLLGCFVAASDLGGMFALAAAFSSGGILVLPAAFIFSAVQGRWDYFFELASELVLVIGCAMLGTKFCAEPKPHKPLSFEDPVEYE